MTVLVRLNNHLDLVSIGRRSWLGMVADTVARTGGVGGKCKRKRIDIILGFKWAWCGGGD
jgi:hypothetical protein